MCIILEMLLSSGDAYFFLNLNKYFVRKTMKRINYKCLNSKDYVRKYLSVHVRNVYGRNVYVVYVQVGRG